MIWTDSGSSKNLRYLSFTETQVKETVRNTVWSPVELEYAKYVWEGKKPVTYIVKSIRTAPLE